MIYLTQWLCPSRHCTIALVWNDKNQTEAEILATGEEYFKQGPIRRLCGICNATDIRPETGKTRFNTIAEAMPTLEILHRGNMMAKRILQDGKN